MNGVKNYVSSLRGDILVILAMLIFGSYALFLRLLPEIPTVVFLLSMQVVGALGFFAVVKTRGEKYSPGRKGWLLLLALAAVALLNDFSYFSAFRLTSVANAAFAHQMVSVFLLLFAPLLLKERTERREVGALAVAIAGLVLLYGNGIALSGGTHFLGISLGLLSAVFYAMLIVLYRHLPAQGLSVSFINMWRYALSSLILLPFVATSGGFALTYKNILLIVGFGVVFAVIATALHTFGISKTRAIHAAVIGKSEPVIASAYALLFLQEIPGTYTVIGGVLIIGAGVWFALQKHPHSVA